MTKRQQTTPIHVPREWLHDVPEDDLTLQEIFRLGLRQYKIERALELYRQDVGSIGYIAERVGISKRDLIREARRRGIEPAFSEETVREEIAK